MAAADNPHRRHNSASKRLPEPPSRGGLIPGPSPITLRTPVVASTTTPRRLSQTMDGGYATTPRLDIESIVRLFCFVCLLACLC